MKQPLKFLEIADRDWYDLNCILPRAKNRSFFELDLTMLVNSDEMKKVVASAVVEPDGIRFGSVHYLVTNAEIATALNLSEQDFSFSPDTGGSFTLGMARELGCNGFLPNQPSCTEICGEVDHGAFILNSPEGSRTWVLLTAERVFFAEKIEMSTTILRRMHDVLHNPGHLLGHIKRTIQLQWERPLTNLMLGFLLRSSSYMQPPAPQGTTDSSSEHTLAEIDRIANDVEDEHIAIRAESEQASPPDTTGTTVVHVDQARFIEVIVDDFEDRLGHCPAVVEDLFLDIMRTFRGGLAIISSKDGEISIVNTEVDKLRKQVTSLQEERTAAESGLQDEIKENKAIIHRLQVEAEESSKEGIAMKEAKEAASKHIGELTEQVTELSAKVLEVDADLRLRLETTTTELTAANNANTALSKEVEAGKQERADYKQLRDFLTKARRTPEQREALLTRNKQKLESEQRPASEDGRQEALLTGKKRKLESQQRPISVDEHKSIVEEVHKKVTEESAHLLKRLDELEKYRRSVQRSASDNLSSAPYRMCPTAISVEGYYQVVSLFVDMYRIAMGIEQTHLSDDQWVLLLGGMPKEGQEVIPRMLHEQRLSAQNVGVCNVLLGGLVHAHIGHLMAAQRWAYDGRANRPTLVQLAAEPLPKDTRSYLEEKGLFMRHHLHQLRQTKDMFLENLETQESTEKLVIGARRMRWAFRHAGWDEENRWEMEEKIEDWMMDYTLNPPTEYIEGMFSLKSPDPRSMRVIEEIIDVGEYLPHEELIDQLETVDSQSWHGLGPTEPLLRWLECRARHVPDFLHYGEMPTQAFCKGRREAQKVGKIAFYKEDEETSPSIYVAMKRIAPLISFDKNATTSAKILMQLKLFYTSFHRGGDNFGGLQDPRLLEAYVFTRGLAGLYACEDEFKTSLEQIRPFHNTRAGGWSLYTQACRVTPLQVRLIHLMAQRNFLPGFHADLGRPLQIAFANAMFEDIPMRQRIDCGFTHTAKNPANHFNIIRQPLPPRASKGAATKKPKELLQGEEDEWSRVFDKHGQDAAVDMIERRRNAMFHDKEAASRALSQEHARMTARAKEIALFLLSPPLKDASCLLPPPVRDASRTQQKKVQRKG